MAPRRTPADERRAGLRELYRYPVDPPADSEEHREEAAEEGEGEMTICPKCGGQVKN